MDVNLLLAPDAHQGSRGHSIRILTMGAGLPMETRCASRAHAQVDFKSASISGGKMKAFVVPYY